jgi:hypothetical protein
MAWWLAASGAATAYLIWLSWSEARHHRPLVALSAALLAAAYVGVFVVLAVSPLVSLPVVPTMVVFVVVEVIVRSMRRFGWFGHRLPFGPRYPIENP